MDVAAGREWLARLEQAWINRDAAAAADLFTVDASYHADPFQLPLTGRAAITRYWASATENQTAINVTFGEPLVAGDRMAVEWWAVTDEKGQKATDVGALFLTFTGESCSELREYWNLTEGAAHIPEGWGR